MVRWRPIMAAVGLLAVTGCADFGADQADDGQEGGIIQPPLTISFGDDIQPIFDQSCAGCHGIGGQAGLDLGVGVSHGNLVGVASTQSSRPLVAPGQPDQSWLYLKLTGQQDAGTEMPPGGSIGAANLDLVRAWIEEGALDN